MKIFYWKNRRPSVYPNFGVDDYGNEYMLINGRSEAFSWYFLGIERALDRI